MKGALALVAVLAAPPAHAAPEVITATYACEREVRVAVAYVNAADGSVAVLQVEGRQVALPQARSASGARYSVDGGASGYVWWSKGDSATLGWFESKQGKEITLLAYCAVAKE